MYRIVILLLAVTATLATQTQVCHTTNVGITQSKAAQLLNEINRIRSSVATGNSKNQDGKDQPAANMNALVWSSAFANRA